jgi:F-type H+-transporting ATPase subunit epsilon
MTAMPDHAPTITTLRPGILKVEAPEGSSEYLVTGGFAQINGDGLSVLAEKAIPVAEVTRSHLDDLIAEARASHEAAKAGEDQTIVDDAAKLLADMEALGTHMSL